MTALSMPLKDTELRSLLHELGAEAARFRFDVAPNPCVGAAILSRGKVKNSKSYPGLLAAAQWMQEGGVAPMAWAAFSFDCWTAFDEKKGDG